MLDPRATQMGIGVDSTTTPAFLFSTSITLGNAGQAPLPLRAVWHWPTDRQTNANPSFIPESELPNPAPDLPVTGTPIMFCGAEGNYAPLHVFNVTLKEANAKDATPIRLLRNTAVAVESPINAEVVTDSNLAPISVYQGCIFVLPTVVLQNDKTYWVTIEASQANKNVNTTWSFTTRSSH